jgi:hypothetical protein
MHEISHEWGKRQLTMSAEKIWRCYESPILKNIVIPSRPPRRIEEGSALVRQSLIRANNAPWFKHEFKRCQPFAWHGCHSALGSVIRERRASLPIPVPQRRSSNRIMCSLITLLRPVLMGTLLSPQKDTWSAVNWSPWLL